MPSTRDHPSVLYSVADLLSRPVTKDQLLRAMVDRVVEALEAERGTLYLLDALTGELCSRVAHLPELKEIRLPIGKGVAGRVAATGKPELLDDVATDEGFFADIDQRTGYTTSNMIAVPVQDARGITRGVLQLLNHRRGRFSHGDLGRLEALARQVAEALEQTSMQSVSDSPEGVLVDGPFNNIVGDSSAMIELYDRILAAATTDATVLIRGESGTGKSLVARAVHDTSERSAGPLVHVDCAALPAGLIESELFGHERGAFTGADRRVVGKFEQAEGGTLLLDEIGDLPLLLQGKLLRFLQEREFERLGGRQTLRADVRVISATNADLEALVAKGAFRQDLYYRVRVVQLQVAPLRDRGPSDVRRLAEHFLGRYARKYRRPARRFSDAAVARLAAHAWPGNVRELEHCVESAVVLCLAEVIEDAQLSLPGGLPGDDVAARPAGYDPELPLAEVERDHIRRVLEHCDGNRTEAARKLGIGRNTLARKLKE